MVLRDLMLHKPGVSLGQGFLERRRRPPAQGEQGRRVESLERHPVGLRGVENQSATIADDIGDEAGDLGDGRLRPVAQVDRVGVSIVTHDENGSIGDVARGDEFASRRPTAPDGDLGPTVALGVVEAPHQRGDDVARGFREIVAGAEGVRGDGCDEVRAVLVAERGTQA